VPGIRPLEQRYFWVITRSYCEYSTEQLKARDRQTADSHSAAQLPFIPRRRGNPNRGAAETHAAYVLLTDLVTRAAKAATVKGAGIAIFGECAPTLLVEGKVDAAIRLEYLGLRSLPNESLCLSGVTGNQEVPVEWTFARGIPTRIDAGTAKSAAIAYTSCHATPPL